MGLSSQKQRAIDELIRREIGPKQAVVKLLGCRYNNKRWSNYQFYLLDSGRTVFVNLDVAPMTAHVSEEVNKLQFRRYQKQQAKQEMRLQQREQAKAKKVKARTAKKPKTVRKPKYDPGKEVLTRMMAVEKAPTPGRVLFDPSLSTLESKEPAKELVHS